MARTTLSRDEVSMREKTPPAGATMHGPILQLATSRGLVLAVSIATAPIVGRMFPPDAYGALNILNAVVSIFGVVATLGYVSAIPLAATPSEGRNLFVICSSLIAITTTLVALVALFGGEQLAVFFHEPQLAGYALFLPLLFFFVAVRQLLDTTLSYQRRFAAVAIRGFAETAGLRFMQICVCPLAGLTGSALGLLISGATSSCLASFVAGLTSVRDVLRKVNEPISRASLVAAAKRHKQFPLVGCWSTMLNAATVGLPTMILGYRFSVVEVGLYGMAFTMVTLPLSLFTASAGQVFYVEAGQRVARGESASPAVQQMVRMLSALTAFPLVVVLLLGPLIFEVFFGAKWREAGVYAQILVPWMALVVFFSPLSTAFAIFDRQAEGLFWNFVLLVGRFSTLFFGGIFFDIRKTLAIFSLFSTLLIALLFFRLLRLFATSRLGVLLHIIRSYIEPLLLSSPSAVAYWGFHNKTIALVALAAASLVYGFVLFRRYPHIVRAIAAKIGLPNVQPPESHLLN